MLLRLPDESGDFWHDIERERGWAWSDYRAALERELVPDAQTALVLVPGGPLLAPRGQFRAAGGAGGRGAWRGAPASWS